MPDADANTRLTRVETALEGHIAECNRRAEVAVWMLRYVVGISTAAFAALVKLAFHL